MEIKFLINYSAIGERLHRVEFFPVRKKFFFLFYFCSGTNIEKMKFPKLFWFTWAKKEEEKSLVYKSIHICFKLFIKWVFLQLNSSILKIEREKIYFSLIKTSIIINVKRCIWYDMKLLSISFSSSSWVNFITMMLCTSSFINFYFAYILLHN